MTISDDKITEVSCQVDTFCFHFHNALAPQILGNPPKKKPKREVITLMIVFHHSGYRTMKGFYNNYVKVHRRHLFPKTVSYNRYVELMASANLPLAMFVKTNVFHETKSLMEWPHWANLPLAFSLALSCTGSR